MMQWLRSPIAKLSWEEMLKKTDMQDSFYVRQHHIMMNLREYRRLFEESFVPGDFERNMLQAMEFDDIESLLENKQQCTRALRYAALHSFVTPCAIWDCTDTGMEFVLPKLPGICLDDHGGTFHQFEVLLKLREQESKERASEITMMEIDRLLYGVMHYGSNFTVHPISPTRILVQFTPYFRAFFPVCDAYGITKVVPPMLGKEQFDRHFYEKMRMELFEPCMNRGNQRYTYKVKHLTWKETCEINGLLLQMETDEFVFHDYNRIRDSFWYYHNMMRFADRKKHDFGHLI